MERGSDDTVHPEVLRHRNARAAGLKTILFVCTGNAIRSQIAEGIVNEEFGGGWAAFSAGTMPLEIQKDVVRVMKETGVDLSDKKAKHVDIFRDCVFDRVVVLCADAGMRCADLPDSRTVDRLIFDDLFSPELLAGGIWLSHTSRLRSLRDEIRKVIRAYLTGA